MDATIVGLVLGAAQVGLLSGIFMKLGALGAVVDGLLERVKKLEGK